MQPIRELSSVAGLCARSGCALIRQLANTNKLATVGIDDGSLQPDPWHKSVGLVEGRQPLGALLCSSKKPRELSQWHDDRSSS